MPRVEEGLRVVKPFSGRKVIKVNTLYQLTLPAEEAPANSVPAAAVIRRVQALIGITGRKAHAGGQLSQMKAPSLTWELHLKLVG